MMRPPRNRLVVEGTTALPPSTPGSSGRASARPRTAPKAESEHILESVLRESERGRAWLGGATQLQRSVFVTLCESLGRALEDGAPARGGARPRTAPHRHSGTNIVSPAIRAQQLDTYRAYLKRKGRFGQLGERERRAFGASPDILRDETVAVLDQVDEAALPAICAWLDRASLPERRCFELIVQDMASNRDQERRALPNLAFASVYKRDYLPMMASGALAVDARLMTQIARLPPLHPLRLRIGNKQQTLASSAVSKALSHHSGGVGSTTYRTLYRRYGLEQQHAFAAVRTSFDPYAGATSSVGITTSDAYQQPAVKGAAAHV